MVERKLTGPRNSSRNKGKKEHERMHEDCTERGLTTARHSYLHRSSLYL
jgi:hypothetical protein